WLIAALSMTAPSAAQSTPATNAGDATEKARELHTKGDMLYEQGDYQGAHAAYLAAWSLKKHYQIAGNLGDCEVRLGRYRDAAEHLSYFLREYPANKPAERREDGRRLFEEARSKIGTIHVAVDPPGAKILVDGELVGESPLQEPLYVEPGSR